MPRLAGRERYAGHRRPRQTDHPRPSRAGRLGAGGAEKASLIAVHGAALCEMVWELLRGYCDTPARVSHVVRASIHVRYVVRSTPAVLAGLALLESGGDFADGVIAFESELLGGHEFVTLDQQAAKLLEAQKRKTGLLKTEIEI